MEKIHTLYAKDGQGRSNAEQKTIQTSEAREQMLQIAARKPILSLEGPPIYKNENGNLPWKSLAFKNGWSFVSRLHPELLEQQKGSTHAKLQHLVLVDDLQSPSTIQDQNEATRRVIAEVNAYSPNTITLPVDEGIMETSLVNFAKEANCRSYDAVFQLRKISALFTYIQEKHHLNRKEATAYFAENVGLFVFHPEEFGPQQLEMVQSLSGLLGRVEPFIGLSRKERHRLLSAYYHVWFDDKTGKFTGITRVTSSNGKLIFSPENNDRKTVTDQSHYIANTPVVEKSNQAASNPMFERRQEENVHKVYMIIGGKERLISSHESKKAANAAKSTYVQNITGILALKPTTDVSTLPIEEIRLNEEQRSMFRLLRSGGLSLSKEEIVESIIQGKGYEELAKSAAQARRTASTEERDVYNRREQFNSTVRVTTISQGTQRLLYLTDGKKNRYIASLDDYSGNVGSYRGLLEQYLARHSGERIDIAQIPLEEILFTAEERERMEEMILARKATRAEIMEQAQQGKRFYLIRRIFKCDT
jgi:hypothetical protein